MQSEQNKSPPEHTQGPWKFNTDQALIEVHASGLSGYTICEGPWGIGCSEEQEANARLISAAPELLRAVEDALHILLLPENSTWTHEKLPNTVLELQHAIAKAKGGAA